MGVLFADLSLVFCVGLQKTAQKYLQVTTFSQTTNDLRVKPDHTRPKASNFSKCPEIPGKPGMEAGTHPGTTSKLLLQPRPILKLFRVPVLVRNLEPARVEVRSRLRGKEKEKALGSISRKVKF